MKSNFIMFIAFLCMSTQITAQTFSKSIKNDIVKNQQVHIDASGTKADIKQSYFIKASKEEDSDYLKIELIAEDPDNHEEAEKKETFKIYPLSIDVFKTRFKKAFLDLVKKSEDSISTIDYNATEFSDLEISLLFVQLISFERTENERPVVANITLKKNIPVIIKFGDTPYYDTYQTAELNKQNKTKNEIEEAKDSLIELTTIKDAKLELTFYNGFIEKVELETTIKSTKIRFSNLFSIGISSSSGIKKFAKNNIQSFYNYKLVEDTLVRDINGSPLTINFADVIDYDREIDINANDISPEPTKLVLTKRDDEIKLYKEESTKLFEAIVFSDFLGVFDEDNPNGILQTEVEKKFYINTRRIQISKLGRTLGGLLFFPFIFSDGVGFGEYVDVSARLSKLEENNKFLNEETVNTVGYFSPIRIMQHQSFSIGGDINIMYLENQNKKINTNLDLGVRYGRSGLQIDDDNQDFFNTITTSAELGFQFIPEKRYGFLAQASLMYFEVYNYDGFNVKSVENGELVSPNKWFNKAQFEFFVNTSTTGKLFIRYNMVTELSDWDNNFSQFQFGYSFYLLKQNGKSK